MRREITIKVTWPDFIKLVAVSPVVVIAVYCVFTLPWGASEAPAWVQAVGSIGAIFAAIWISDTQGRKNDIERRRSEYHYMLKAFNLGCYAQEVAHGTVEAVCGRRSAFDLADLLIPELKEAFKEINGFSYRDMVCIDFANAWIEHKRTMREFIAAASRRSQSTTLIAKRAQDHIDSMRTLLERHSINIGEMAWGKDLP